MYFDRATLDTAIAASGGVTQPDDQVNGLVAKLQMLESTGRYAPMLKSIAKANDRSNFFSLLLEATFAHQFESNGIRLQYEVNQVTNDCTSVDFALKLDDGCTTYFELRLLQQDQATAKDIAKKFTDAGVYSVSKNGADEQREVLKLQGIVLSKVQEKSDKPIKFLKVDSSVVNIVAVCVSDILLGTADKNDCIIATYGDPAVPEYCRRGVFGLFQDELLGYPPEILVVAKRFAHLKATIHAVLFLFRPRGSGILDYDLQQVLVWNRGLIMEPRARSVSEQVFLAIPPLM
jgi:hypothetical protein